MQRIQESVDRMEHASRRGRWPMRLSRHVTAVLLVMASSELASAEEPRSREAMPDVARPLVRPMMQQHGDDLLQLVTAVVLLQYPEIDEAARRIAVTPILARTSSPADAGQLQMPPRFYALQDQLKERARGLGRSARMRDDAALARDLGMMMQACVSCHSAYLKRPASRQAPVPTER